ncbi:hypothetical protein IEE94_11110 [Yimella sp. cx-573]|nr:hypothetical protein [Yimella sp. cx-573]
MTDNPTRDTVFGEACHDGECCDCSAGYCPACEVDEPQQELFEVTVNGVDYYTDRYLAIRADVFTKPIAGVSDVKPKRLEWPIPDTKPKPSRAVLNAEYIGRFRELGWDVRQGYDVGNRQHVYRGDDHIGWLMEMAPWASPSGCLHGSAMRLVDADTIAFIARAYDPLPVGMSRFAGAATVLNLARQLAEEGLLGAPTPTA